MGKAVGLLLAVAAFLCLAGFSEGRAFAAAPDTTYREGLREFKHLSTDAKAGKSREKWLALDKTFVAVYRDAPNGPLAPKALFYRGWVHEELALRSFLKKDATACLDLYQRMIDRYPRHEWADDAYVRRAAVFRDRLKDPAQAMAELRAVIKRYPDGDKIAEAVEMLRALDPSFVPEPRTADPGKDMAKTAPTPGASNAPGGGSSSSAAPNLASPSSPALLSDISKTGGDDYSRITLCLDKETSYRYQLLDQAPGESAAPRRLYIDLDNVKLGPNVRPDEKISDGILRQIRTAYNKPNVVRVVLDIDNLDRQNVFTLDSPFRVVLDVYAKAKAGKPRSPAETREEAAPTSAGSGAKPDDKYDGWLANLFKRKDTTSAPSGKSAATAKDGKDAATAAMREETAQAAKDAAATSAKAPAPSAKAPAVSAYTPPPGSEKRIGDLVEQLGLTVRTIMVDAGHGGKDPGAQGLNTLVEKDVNLRFARILGKKLEDHGFTVLYTRTRDVFIPLEERTAMANAKKADLFVSIHCNAHGDAKSSGLEIYSLNLASTEDAVRVAARENAVSAKTISDLQLILTDLMLNTKMKESRDLAKTVQTQTIGSVSGRWKTRDRGTHEAPFYVLMGARMPAVLVEMGYITNPDDAKRLASDKYLEALAQGMVNGLVAYKQRIERFTGEAAPKAVKKKSAS
ncbi:N-acetylmuramoyl-L-alanine amidase [Desulfolutivibrio sulfoxidireducens]|uniref:N-acetylmuramoyl-L-alanine amidase n=1 Tax=Desulfolutivibrio sulfoxidireducens TaxID=2773299 RepID=UPI00159E5CEF|nr:N-acetylmuramoyl-L-alanine amidase [Desulfolutivibrio sulfoxidireducens]QLA15076.1 AMIN domain-containing protein [Desulfolutivibrio sulfoxidireducens]